jgi:hypothetical protein
MRTACGTGECGGRWKLTGYEMCWDCPGKWRRELRLNEVGQDYEGTEKMKECVGYPGEREIDRFRN